MYLFLLILAISVVGANSVLPVVPLEQMQHISHACLFICNICFADQVENLLECANVVCQPNLSTLTLMRKFIWVGQMCGDPVQLEQVWASD